MLTRLVISNLVFTLYKIKDEIFKYVF